MLQIRFVVLQPNITGIVARVERLSDGKFYDNATRSFVREVPAAWVPVSNVNNVASLDVESAGWEDDVYHVSFHNDSVAGKPAILSEYANVIDGSNLYRKCDDC